MSPYNKLRKDTKKYLLSDLKVTESEMRRLSTSEILKLSDLRHTNQKRKKQKFFNKLFTFKFI